MHNPISRHQAPSCGAPRLAVSLPRIMESQRGSFALVLCLFSLPCTPVREYVLTTQATVLSTLPCYCQAVPIVNFSSPTNGQSMSSLWHADTSGASSGIDASPGPDPQAVLLILGTSAIERRTLPEPSWLPLRRPKAIDPVRSFQEGGQPLPVPVLNFLRHDWKRWRTETVLLVAQAQKGGRIFHAEVA